MKQKTLIKYQKNFADNFTSYVYGRILEQKYSENCCFENITSKRKLFEEKMMYFNFDCKYTSILKVEDITSFALKLNDEKKFNNKVKYNFIERKFFSPDDTIYLTDDIKNELAFKNLDFIKDYDILDDIVSSNSIGIYINIDDIENNLVDFNFIKNALLRLNKYLKKPILYVFSKSKCDFDFDEIMQYKVLDIQDWKQEYYFLSKCAHKIVLSAPKSYSINFWAAILNEKDYNYVVFDLKNHYKKSKRNWLKV